MAGHPKLRTDLEISHFDEGDGRESIIVKNPVSERYFRITDYEYQFLKKLDGTVGLDEAREQLRLEGRHYSSDQATTIVENAAQMGLMLGTAFGTAEFQMSAKAIRGKNKRLRVLSSLFFLYVPLINPDRFLDRTVRIFQVIVNRYFMAACGLLGLVAVYLMILGLPRLQTEYLFFFTTENLLYLWLVIALSKLVHELGHAYAAKSFGLQVNTMGLAFLLFIPCLYCDTTESWKLAGRRQRMLISAAGIGSELVLAILGVFLWYFTKPGVVNSLAFYLVAVSLISTIFFNGNPLLKFDGYFILMAYLRLPNLAAKSIAYLKYLFMNKALGIASYGNPARTEKESFIFSIYGVSSFVYRFFLYPAIIAGLYLKFDKTLGVLMASLALFLFVIRPLVIGAVNLWEKRSELHVGVAGALSTVAALTAFMLFVLWPWSYNMTFPCVLDSVEAQKITVPLQCSVTRVFIHEGMSVKKGTLMFQLEPKALDLLLLKARLEHQLLKDTIRLLTLEEEGLSHLPEKTVELYRTGELITKIEQEKQLALYGIEAPFDGVVTSLDSRMQSGFQPGEGAVVGELKSPTDCVVHALVPGRFLKSVKAAPEATIWFPVQSGAMFHRKFTRVRSTNERDLRDSAFSSARGGEIAVDIVGRTMVEPPLEDHYVCSFDFPENRTVPLGMTGRIVVSSPPRSILANVYGAVVQVFNRESFL
ncbi:MAG: site-2 protease family protein [Deltaproteobacteria bacterium]